MNNQALVEQLEQNVHFPEMDVGEIMALPNAREQHEQMISRVIELNANDPESIRVIREALKNTAKASLLTEKLMRDNMPDMPDELAVEVMRDRAGVEFLKGMNELLDNIVLEEQQPPFEPPLPFVPQELTQGQRFTSDIISKGISNAMRYLPQ